MPEANLRVISGSFAGRGHAMSDEEWIPAVDIIQKNNYLVNKKISGDGRRLQHILDTRTRGHAASHMS